MTATVPPPKVPPLSSASYPACLRCATPQTAPCTTSVPRTMRIAGNLVKHATSTEPGARALPDDDHQLRRSATLRALTALKFYYSQDDTIALSALKMRPFDDRFWWAFCRKFVVNLRIVVNLPIFNVLFDSLIHVAVVPPRLSTAFHFDQTRPPCASLP